MGASVDLIIENSLLLKPEGFGFRVRLNWYRSLPLSCIENIEVSINNEPVSSEYIWFAINDNTYQLEDLAKLVDEFWFVQDHAEIQIRQSGIVDKGKKYKLDAAVAVRKPYIKIGPNKFLVKVSQHTTMQEAR